MDVTITKKCNNNCFFCPKDKFLSIIACEDLSEIKKDILKIKGLTDRIALSGGEITISRHFFKVLSFCKKLNFAKISIISNGRTFHNLTFAKKVILAGVKDFAISIYSLQPCIHDKITRVKGSCQETIAGIKNLIALKSKNVFSLRINLVLNCLNYDDIFHTLLQLNNAGITNFILAEQIILNNKQNHLSLNVIKKFLAEIVNLRIKNGYIVLRGFAPCLFENKYSSFFLKNKLLKTDSSYLRFEAQNMNTFEKKRIKKDAYMKKIKNLYLKKDSCLNCSYHLFCPGLQKAYFS